MKFSQAKQGRVFVIRLEDGDIIHESIEKFAREHNITAAVLVIVGGAKGQSKLVVGPANSESLPPNPMLHSLTEAHEITGTGTIFPDEDGNPTLHMHISCGRMSSTITGCVREGVKTWHIAEVVLFELVDTSAVRKLDSALGFKLLNP